MYTIIETPTFKNDADSIWTEDERGDFCTWIADNHDLGDVILGSGGVRVIYYTKLKNGEIWLLVIFSKSETENIPSHILKSIKEVIDNG